MITTNFIKHKQSYFIHTTFTKNQISLRVTFVIHLLFFNLKKQTITFTTTSALKAKKINSSGARKTNANNILSGKDTSQIAKMSSHITNFVSPPPRKIPFIAMTLIESVKTKNDVIAIKFIANFLVCGAKL